MNFLKQNLFLVCTVLLLVVAGAVPVSMYRSDVKEGLAHIEERRSVNTSLKSLRQGTLVNQAVVKAAEGRVDQMNAQQRGAADWFLSKNSAGRDVLTFKDPDDPAQALAAFPIDKDLYGQKGLWLEFPKVYRQRVLEILKSLNPTRPPTPEEIRAEEALIIEQAAPQPTGAGSPRVRPTPAMPYRYPGDYLDMMDSRMRGPMPPGRRRITRPPIAPRTPAAPGTPVTTAPAEPIAAEKAHSRMVGKWASAGEIYADETAMHMAVEQSSVPTFTDDLLWMAQLSLWVQQDIAAAIREANQGYRLAHKANPRGEGVPSSAVKRLVGINLLGYVMNRAGGGTGLSTGMTGGAGSEALPAGGMGGAKDLVYLSQGVSRTTGSAGSPYSLTERHCNPVYDVVHYDFTVIVASTELVRLYKSLMARNLHTILDVNVSAVGKARTPGRRDAMGPGVRGELHYYGTDPVVQARITCELLLLTDWTRGRELPAVAGGAPPSAVPPTDEAIRWDPKYPPVVPVEILRSMQLTDPAALRDVDTRRVGAPADLPPGGTR